MALLNLRTPARSWTPAATLHWHEDLPAGCRADNLRSTFGLGYASATSAKLVLTLGTLRDTRQSNCPCHLRKSGRAS